MERTAVLGRETYPKEEGEGRRNEVRTWTGRRGESEKREERMGQPYVRGIRGERQGNGILRTFTGFY